MAQKGEKVGVFTYIGYLFHNLINEFVVLFNAFLAGIKYIFVGLPMSFVGLFKKKEKVIEEEQQILKENNVSALLNSDASFELQLQSKNQSRDLVQIVSGYIEKKYNEIPSVKRKKEAYEASLVPLILDPNGADSVKSPEKQTYKYVARNKEGKVITGYFPAFSKMDVYSYLTDEKMIVYEITTSKSINFLHAESKAFKSRIKNKDLVFWLTQLSTYIKSGIPLTDGVKILAAQDRRKKYRSIYESLIYELTMGHTFSEALEKQGSAFPALLVNMIKSSEMIGDIESTLDDMAEYYQEIEDTKRAVISAISYPAVVLVFAIGIVIFMLVYIVPKFVDVYSSMDVGINPITQACLDLSSFMKTNYFGIILFVIIFNVVFVYSFKKVKLFKTAVQRLLMHLPVVGKLIIAKEINLFARTFASLQKNNVLLTDSIEVLSKITNNEVYRDLMLRTINNLIKGGLMSETFKDHWAIPQLAYFMIVTGESTGELAEMLDKVADFYQKQERQIVGTIKTFIEPVMIISLAVVVGFILIAVLIPMFDIYKNVT